MKWSIKQNFDNAELCITDEEDGEVQLEVVLELTDTKEMRSAVIWLDDSQRKDLIRRLLKCGDKQHA